MAWGLGAGSGGGRLDMDRIGTSSHVFPCVPMLAKSGKMAFLRERRELFGSKEADAETQIGRETELVRLGPPSILSSKHIILRR